MQKVNEVRHSPNMEHTQAATEYLINSFLTLLSDSKYLNTDEYAKTAREKLEKVTDLMSFKYGKILLFLKRKSHLYES